MITGIMTLVILVSGDIIPKNYDVVNAEKFYRKISKLCIQKVK